MAGASQNSRISKSANQKQRDNPPRVQQISLTTPAPNAWGAGK